MITTIVGALIGFATPILQEGLSIYKEDRAHQREIEMLKLQSDIADKEHLYKMQALNVEGDIEELKQLHLSDRDSGVRWVEALRGTVRPFLTYAFFGAYIAVKAAQFIAVAEVKGLDQWEQVVLLTWREEDMALFATIISFWFGSRSREKFYSYIRGKAA